MWQSLFLDDQHNGMHAWPDANLQRATALLGAMTPAGLEPAIPGSVGRCLIHWATGPIKKCNCNKFKRIRKENHSAVSRVLLAVLLFSAVFPSLLLLGCSSLAAAFLLPFHCFFCRFCLSASFGIVDNILFGIVPKQKALQGGC